jgi:molybdopterin-guanine dinucleotide biosynthesis protein A
MPYSDFVIFRAKNLYNGRNTLTTSRSHGDSTLLSKSAIILAGGLSSRFGQDKGLLQLAGKPLVRHVLNAVDNVVDEKIIVVSCREDVDKYVKATNASASIIADKANLHSPLAGALTGFEEASGEFSLLLPCDTPFASRDILSLLLELCPGRNACVPRWPNGYVEPLQAVYRTEPALEASNVALRAGKLNVQAMLDRLQCVRYVSTLVLKQLDPELRTFFNVNTPLDLKKAEQMLSHRRASVLHG